MTPAASAPVFSAVQHLLDAGLLTTTVPWDQGRLEHIARALAPEWGMAVSTDNVVVALPNPPRTSGFSPTVVAYGHYCSPTASSVRPTALADALTREATSPLYCEIAVSVGPTTGQSPTVSMSATYTTDSGHQASVTEYLHPVLLQSGAGGARTLIEKAVHNPVALISQAPVKALATITASGFRHPKANTLPWPLRSARIASIPCSVLYADTGFLNPPPLGPRIRFNLS
jgi:hypothetical protein